MGGSSPSCGEGPSLLFRVRGEARRAGIGGSQPPPHQLEGLQNVFSSLGGVRGGASAAIRFTCILDTPDDFCWKLLRAKFRGRHGPSAPLPRLKSACVGAASCLDAGTVAYLEVVVDAVEGAIVRVAGRPADAAAVGVRVVATLPVSVGAHAASTQPTTGPHQTAPSKEVIYSMLEAAQPA